MNTEKKFSELGFFSKHFNVPLENLTWGIKQEIINGYHDFSICISIKNTNLCIDVVKGEIHSILDLSPSIERILHEASFKDEGEQIVLETVAKIDNGNTVIFEFSEEDLRSIYQKRWYDESLNGKLLL